ncbi:nitrite extrusion protein 2 [Providencia heimbachae]|nr:nitrite extrusion protein 2 [Providencia heimbachae]
MVVLVGLAIDQIAQSGLSSLLVIYYLAQLFSCNTNYNGEDVAYFEPQRCWLRSLISVTCLLYELLFV